MTKNQKISDSLKRYHRRKKTLRDVKIIMIPIVTLIIIMAIAGVTQATPLTADTDRHNFLPRNEDKEMTVPEKVVYYAQRSDVDIKTALRIADCESDFRPEVESPISSATGIFQFIDKTWANYCVGDRKNADDNIKCFMKLYPKHQSWWECI